MQFKLLNINLTYIHKVMQSNDGSPFPIHLENYYYLSMAHIQVPYLSRDLIHYNIKISSNKLELFKKRLSKGLELRKHFFSQRIVDKWNKLPLSVVNAETTNQFKNRLDKHWTKNGYGTLKG